MSVSLKAWEMVPVPQVQVWPGCFAWKWKSSIELSDCTLGYLCKLNSSEGRGSLEVSSREPFDTERKQSGFKSVCKAVLPGPFPRLHKEMLLCGQECKRICISVTRILTPVLQKTINSFCLVWEVSFYNRLPPHFVSFFPNMLICQLAPQSTHKFSV